MEQVILENITSGQDSSVAPLVSVTALRTIETAFLVLLSSFVCVFGIFSNIVNLIIFWKHGFRESITVGLTGLAVSDLGAVISGIILSICFNPMIPFSELGVNIIEVQKLVGSRPRVCFARITGLITMYLAFERCLCVAVPLHVKRILTPRRTLAAVMSISALVILIDSPIYAAFRLDWTFSPSKNASELGIVSAPNAKDLQGVSFVISASVQVISFVVLVVLTSVLVVLLKRRSQWRTQVTRSTAGSSHRKDISRQEQKAIRLTIMVATILICSLLPGSLLFFAAFLEPEFNTGRRYQNLYISIWSVISFSEVSNSSANIFVYYKMNTKYRNTFRDLFCRKKDVVTASPGDMSGSVK
ncbi:probable G-protein coupled receptor B0563.6 [Aplysia californica]|uniref:Probable G-protein coupled receptor B0563.6 n=1 Tax=Aplysia californica TaxID=6500 RepID=A0ABM0JX47_APLCA|nr:probable G-protein coupled receptor B0563.6 [Aplysia californica]